MNWLTNLDYNGNSNLSAALMESLLVPEGAMSLSILQIAKSEQASSLSLAQPFTLPESFLTMLASEEVLATDWNTPEEDEAWSDL